MVSKSCSRSQGQPRAGIAQPRHDRQQPVDPARGIAAHRVGLKGVVGHRATLAGRAGNAKSVGRPEGRHPVNQAGRAAISAARASPSMAESGAW